MKREIVMPNDTMAMQIGYRLIFH